MNYSLLEPLCQNESKWTSLIVLELLSYIQYICELAIIIFFLIKPTAHINHIFQIIAWEFAREPRVFEFTLNLQIMATWGQKT